VAAGQILWIDVRKGARPKEPHKLRPGVVVENTALFAPGFPNIIVVPCTTALTFEVMDLCVQIEPDDRNGFDRVNWAIAHTGRVGPARSTGRREGPANDHHALCREPVAACATGAPGR
jgi:hypothetical protein